MARFKCHQTLVIPKFFVFTFYIEKKMNNFYISWEKKKKRYITFGIHWYGWGVGGLLGMTLNYIHAWGFRHTGMGWRSLQTLNCEAEWIFENLEKNPPQRKEDKPWWDWFSNGWMLKGTNISLVTVFGFDLNLPEPSHSGRVYVAWGTCGLCSKRVHHQAGDR